MSEALVVLARSPKPGSGKTRLRAALDACPPPLVDELVAAMVGDTLALAARSGRLTVICGTGDPGILRLLAGPGPRLVAQPDAGLGARIEAAIAAGLGLGAERVIQIGTDSPTLPETLIDRALAALRDDSEVALIPALDGGWVGLASRVRVDGLLEAGGIRWSTPHAALDTRRSLDAAGLRVTVLEPWFDVDDLTGLERLVADPVSMARAPRTAAAVSQLRKWAHRAEAGAA